LPIEIARFNDAAYEKGMKSSIRISPTLAGLRLVINMAHRTDGLRGRPSHRPTRDGT
jgi:hypothetical protein